MPRDIDREGGEPKEHEGDPREDRANRSAGKCDEEVAHVAGWLPVATVGTPSTGTAASKSLPIQPLRPPGQAVRNAAQLQGFRNMGTTGLDLRPLACEAVTASRGLPTPRHCSLWVPFGSRRGVRR